MRTTSSFCACSGFASCSAIPVIYGFADLCFPVRCPSQAAIGGDRSSAKSEQSSDKQHELYVRDRASRKGVALFAKG